MQEKTKKEMQRLEALRNLVMQDIRNRDILPTTIII